MELHFNQGIPGKPDKLSATISIYSEKFMILNCVFKIGFVHSGGIAFALKSDGSEFDRIVLTLFKDLYFDTPNMININKRVTVKGNSVEFVVAEHDNKPFDLTLNYI